MMKAGPHESSIADGSSEAAPAAPIVERLTPDGLRPVCSEEGVVLSAPRDDCGQGGFSDAGQQQVLIEEKPSEENEDANS